MADLTKNPWRFTSGDVSANPYSRMVIRPRRITWNGSAAATDKVIIKDLDGRVVCQLEAQSTDWTEDREFTGCDPATDWNGFVLTQLDGAASVVHFWYG